MYLSVVPFRHCRQSEDLVITVHSSLLWGIEYQVGKMFISWPQADDKGVCKPSRRPTAIPASELLPHQFSSSSSWIAS